MASSMNFANPGARRMALALGLAVALGGCTTATQQAMSAGSPALTLPPGPTPTVSSNWADARARGVTLRALGQEPGWLIEVGPNNRTVMRVQGDERPWVIDAAVLYRAADGQRLEGLALAWAHASATPSPTAGPGTAASTTANAEGQSGVMRPQRQRVQLAVRLQPCTDTMSGQTFEASAVLQLGERRLNGCANLARP